MSRAIFLPAIGQYENIGDIILRRPLVDWARRQGQLHLYLGHAPTGFVEGLRLKPEDVIYASFFSWLLAGLKLALRGGVDYVCKPGEIQLTLIGMKEHLGVLPLLILIRLTGGRVVRLGSGTRNFAKGPKWLMWPAVALSQLVYWRDTATAAFMGRGKAMPDLAFSEGLQPDQMTPFENRKILVVSMRGDRQGVPHAWYDAVKTFAERHSLEIWAVTQVECDSALSREMAQRLGGKLLDWDGRDHHAQEIKLDDLYARTAVAVSDRLHVLIAAYTYGACPIALQTDESRKIERHFGTIGVTDITIGVTEAASDPLPARMDRIWARREAIRARLREARERLAAVRSEMDRLLSRHSG